MNKLFFIFVFVLSFNFSFSQTSTEKWNEYKKQYEYYDSNGNMIAYKIYNSYKNQWETYSVQSNIYQPQPVVNTELVQKTLLTLQAKYDANLENLNKWINFYRSYVQASGKLNGYSYDYGITALNYFNKNYVDKIKNGSNDLSSDSLTSELIKFLANGAFKVSCDYFKDCN